MENYWIPGVNNQGGYGRYQIESDFEAEVGSEFDQMIDAYIESGPTFIRM
jgi:hypothetical protein